MAATAELTKGGIIASLDPSAIGARISLARREAGLSQRELAERIGVIPRSVQNYEAGRIPWKLLDSIAEATSRPKEWLLYGPDVVEGEVPDQGDLGKRLDRIESVLAEILAALKGKV